MRQKVSIIVDRLLDQSVEIVVCEWRTGRIPYWLSMPQGPAEQLKKKAGSEPFKELAEQGPMALGSARLTGTGRLLIYKGIVFAAALDARHRATEESIAAAARSAMRIVMELGFRSVAFPVLGAGHGVPEDRALEILNGTLSSIETQVDVLIVRSRERAD